MTIDGTNLGAADKITIGGIECLDLAHESSSRVRCTTGARELVEGLADVIVTGTLGQRAELPGAFTYECPWTTSTGRRSCGAAPPRAIAPQPITMWVAQLEEAMQTDGFGTPVSLRHIAIGQFDMRGQQLKLFLSTQNLAAAADLSLFVGDSNLQNAFQFRLRANQGQQWITDGDAVGFSISWSPENFTTVGNPNRAFITDFAVRLVDNATGVPVQVQIEGLALVPEPADRYPDGVLTFTFDDNWDDMMLVGAPTLARYDFRATAFVIVDRIGAGERATLADLETLHDKGWDIAAHAFTTAHHDARFPTLPMNVVEDDMVDTRAFLMAHGFKGYDHCAYPGGDFTYGGSNILPIATKYFASCRTIFQRTREAVPPADARKLRVLYVRQSTSLFAAQQAVNNAIANREWIILVFHKLVDVPPAANTEWPSANFTGLVDHVAQSGIPVQTITDVLDEPR